MHLQRGYTDTSFASQGKSRRPVFAALGTESFGAATNLQQFYVTASRGKGREGAGAGAHGINPLMIFTDDKAGLLRQLQQESRELSAIDAAAKHQQQARERALAERRQRYAAIQSRVRGYAGWMQRKAQQGAERFRRNDCSHALI